LIEGARVDGAIGTQFCGRYKLAVPTKTATKAATLWYAVGGDRETRRRGGKEKGRRVDFSYDKMTR
jgi:hypothetical protein